MSSHDYNPVRQHCMNNSASEKHLRPSSFPDDDLLLGMNSIPHPGTVESELPVKMVRGWPGKRLSFFFLWRISRHLWGISAPNMDFQIQSLIWVFSSDQWVEVFSWQVRIDCIWLQKCKAKGQRSLGFSVSESYQSRQEDYLNTTTTLKQLQSGPRSTWRLLESKEVLKSSVRQGQLVQNAGPDLANIRGLEPEPPSPGQTLLLVFQALIVLGPNWSF